MYFNFVSESGDVYSGDVYASTNLEFSFEIYKGNEKEACTGGLVKMGEKADLKYDPITTSAVFFDLGVIKLI